MYASFIVGCMNHSAYILFEDLQQKTRKPLVRFLVSHNPFFELLVVGFEKQTYFNQSGDSASTQQQLFFMKTMLNDFKQFEMSTVFWRRTLELLIVSVNPCHVVICDVTWQLSVAKLFSLFTSHVLCIWSLSDWKWFRNSFIFQISHKTNWKCQDWLWKTYRKV